MPRLLLLAPDDRYFWTHRRHLARAARAAGYEVLVAVPDGLYARRLREEGFAVRPVAMRQVRTLRAAVRAFRDVVGLYRRERPDLVHHVSMRAVLAGGLAARLTRVPGRVALVPGLGSLFVSGRPWQRALVAMAYRIVLAGTRTLVVFQNEDDRGWFLRRRLVPLERSRLVPGSGVELERFLPLPPPGSRPATGGPPVILCAGRLIADKGIPVLVEACRLLRARGVAHRLLLVGDPDAGNPSSIPESMLRSWAAAGLAEWRTWTDRVEDCYAAADLACLPSRREGLPLFLLEAAAAGLPVVAGDSPGCRDAVVPGETGLLAPPDDPGALASALETLLRDPALRRRMGEAGRRRAALLHGAATVDAATLAIYGEALPAAAGVPSPVTA